ncbi:ABC transporter substrate-binding protein [Gryllotalpicola protaetiae]|uniref:ABC transporter substrate-binding protein n=1 Tax=Gryllotalpicola protaetiae TaxID=2419771 RepID=A0A387BMZ3_9MICO|nr:ABC transporter substrate-binding protein [Gryllotalpicola protaetiae]
MSPFERAVGDRLRLTRRRVAAGSVLLALAAAVSGCASGSSPAAGTAADLTTAKTSAGTVSGGTLVVGLTAANLPSADTVLAGQQGNEGLRFVAYQLYDGLTRLDLDSTTATPQPQPDLATSWSANADATVWTFRLRTDVAFTDGTPFNADAVIFNLDRYFDADSPFADPSIQGLAASYVPGVASFRALDADTVEITTRTPDAGFPEDAANLFMASPTAVRKSGNDGFASSPVGTGPFVYEGSANNQLTMAANPRYWAGAPKLDKVVLKPIPDSAQRTAALRSGSVNWVEDPNPDDLAGLKDAGFQVLSNSYDHDWTWVFNLQAGPLGKAQVRRALNYGIDRATMSSDLLHGTGNASYQVAPVSNSAYSKSNDLYSYDPDKAKKLLAEAGYPDGFSLTVEYPTAGSGNMIPTPMNEELQADLAKIGVEVKLLPTEWATLLTQYQSGKFAPGVDALNISLPFNQEAIWSEAFGTGGVINAGGYSNPHVDELIAEAQKTVDSDKRYAILQTVAGLVTRDAPWLFIVNDRAPRAMAPSVHNFTQPKAWFIDLTKASVSN